MVGSSVENRAVRAVLLVSAFAVCALSAGHLAALPGDAPDRAAPLFQPVQDTGGGAVSSGPARLNPEQTPSFLELNDALAATRAKVETLARAVEMARTVGELRQQLAHARTENQRLLDELERARVKVAERERSGEAANERIAELAIAAQQVAAEAARARQELNDANRRYADLEKRLANAQAELASAKVQIEEADAATASRIKELIDASEQSDAEVNRLRDRLLATEQRIGSLVRARVDAEARLAELRPGLEAARQEAARLRGQLAKAQTELDEAGAGRAAAEEERNAARVQSEFLAGRLRRELAAANEKMKRVMAKNGELEAELGSLRAAAAAAADAAQENMLAVESRIDALDAALDDQGSAGATPEAADVAIDLAPAGAAGDRRGSTGASPRDQANGGADVVGSRISGASSNTGPDRTEPSDPEPPAAPGPLAELTAGLAPDARPQAQRLLGDLNAKADGRALMITVPGASLFQTDSETIDEAAHATLAKLAELAKLYDDRSLLILGHTDALGEAAYNQYLSTRRAEVVRDFLVENFEIEEARLAIEGRGEEQPIASNATRDGRMANRRVEVLLLN
jgi:outer membrane protein OmpA-like peptidoglycan-associated protein/predicted  nucleic acid-binding Zn-ribbon protein